MKRWWPHALTAGIAGAALIDARHLQLAEWHPGALRLLEQIRNAAPGWRDGHLLYDIVAIATDTILPLDPMLALDVLSLAGAVVAVWWTMQLRVKVAPTGMLAERFVAGAAILVCGVQGLVAPAAGPATWAAGLSAWAAAVAWGGRPVAGMWVFVAAVATSAGAVTNLPILLFSIRLRQDWRGSVPPLVACLIFLLPVASRPGLDLHGDTPAWVQSLVPFLVGSLGLLPVWILGGLAEWRRGFRGRRFVWATLVTLVVHALVHVGDDSYGTSWVAVLPWLATLAGAAVPFISGAGARFAAVGPRGTGFVIVGALLANAALAHQHLVDPVWRQAREFTELSTVLASAFRTARVSGPADHVVWYRLSTRSGNDLPVIDAGTVRWRRAQRPDREIRQGLDRVAESSGLLLLVDRGLVARFVRGAPLGEQLRIDSSSPQRSLGGFEERLTLTRALALPPRPNRGGVLALQLQWSLDAPLERLPRVSVRIVDGHGVARLSRSYWLGQGILGAPAIEPGAHLAENLVLRIPDDLETGEYGIEIGLYTPRAGDSLFRDLRLEWVTSKAWTVRAGVAPVGINHGTLRAATLRISQ